MSCRFFSSLKIACVVQQVSIYHNKTTFAATRRVFFWALNASQVHLWSELHTEPRWGSLQRSPKPPSWWGEGSAGPLPHTPLPLSAFGIKFRPFGPQEFTPKTNSWLRPLSE